MAPHFILTDETAEAVAQVCERLDGIPLALELAAARVGVLSVEGIADRLGDSFRLLVDGSRTAPPRHHTLRAAVEWSYELLSETERQVFNRLAVVSGGWTLPAIEAVCEGEGIQPEQVLEVLAHLVNKSLVLAGPGADRGARYRLPRSTSWLT